MALRSQRHFFFFLETRVRYGGKWHCLKCATCYQLPDSSVSYLLPATSYQQIRRRVFPALQIAASRQQVAGAGVSKLVAGSALQTSASCRHIEVTPGTREIGVRKATGARNKDLLAQFFAESVAIAGLGSVLGTLLGISVAIGVAAVMRAKTMAQVHAGFSLSTLIVAVGAPIIVGIAFGIYPALRVARLSPIDAIRHE
jgi:predicted lysophospholipase L1 biosynthesis ABC-type transport system permease subunit